MFGGRALILDSAIGQIPIKDRTNGALASFYDLHKKINAGQLQVPQDVRMLVNELAAKSKQLITLRITTRREIEELRLSGPAVLMEASKELKNILNTIRAHRAKPRAERLKIT